MIEVLAVLIYRIFELLKLLEFPTVHKCWNDFIGILELLEFRESGLSPRPHRPYPIVIMSE